MNLLSNQERSDAECTTTAIPLGTTVRGRILVERRSNIAIYEGPPGAYEVIVIRIAEASEIGGASLPRREQYPSANFWGTFGFTYSPASHPDGPLAAAKEKMKKLIRSAKTGNATERLLLRPPKKTLPRSAARQEARPARSGAEAPLVGRSSD